MKRKTAGLLLASMMMAANLGIDTNLIPRYYDNDGYRRIGHRSQSKQRKINRRRGIFK